MYFPYCVGGAFRDFLRSAAAEERISQFLHAGALKAHKK
jgi:hypothetical protein